MVNREPVTAALPTLGAGLGFREPFRSDVFRHRGEVGFLEITADHYFDAAPEKRDELELLREHFTLIPHGLELSLGSVDGIDPEYAEKFAALVERLKPPWWSDHIAFTRAGGLEIGHLSPLPFTSEAADTVCANVESIRRLIPAPLILENITYTIQLPGAEMSEADFLSRILRDSGCGLLLDVTNLYTNGVNHGYDPAAMLAELPLERVAQLHFAGGHWTGGELIDSHAHPTMDEVWELMDEVVRIAPVKAITLERDENLPPFSEILQEIERARGIGRAHSRWN